VEIRLSAPRRSACLQTRYTEATPFELYATIAGALFAVTAVETGDQAGRIGHRTVSSSFIVGARRAGWPSGFVHADTGNSIPFLHADISRSFFFFFLLLTAGATTRVQLSYRQQPVLHPGSIFARNGHLIPMVLPHLARIYSRQRATMYFDRHAAVRNDPEREG